MEAQHFEKQPGLVKIHKVATVLMWISFKLKTVKETGWQLVLTGGFLVMYFLLSIRLFY